MLLFLLQASFNRLNMSSDRLGRHSWRHQSHFKLKFIVIPETEDLFLITSVAYFLELVRFCVVCHRILGILSSFFARQSEIVVDDN